MSKIIVTVVNFFGILLFVFFAYLQHDDNNSEIYANPKLLDVWMWIAFYGLVALLFGLTIWWRVPRLLCLVAFCFCAYKLSITAPGFVTNLTSGHFTLTKAGMSPDRSEVELTREFFGALIALAGVSFLWWQRNKVSLKGQHKYINSPKELSINRNPRQKTKLK